jgi:hypothetical protein
MKVRPLVFILVAFLLAFQLSAEEDSFFSADFDIGIGAQTFVEGNTTITYQSLTLAPDLSFGDFGIGIEFVLNYRFNGGTNNDSFEVRSEDWVPNDDTSFLELYLPKFRYIRWAFKGDPLYIKLGSIDDAVLGNGFILGGYANDLYLPETRIFGAQVDLDGRLFNFPLVGIETFAGNVANFDVFAVRGYVRPLISTKLPVVKLLEIGLTFATDMDPYRFIEDKPADADSASISMTGVDFKLPLISNALISSAFFGDFVMQPNSQGLMFGFGGRFFSFLPYVAQIRFLGENFMPTYFDPIYDLYRAEKYAIAKDGAATLEPFTGWFISSGISLVEDLIVFNASLDGPFGLVDEINQDNYINYPHLRAVFEIKEGLIPGFGLFFDASYDKRNIQEWSDLVSAEDATIQAAINYRTGPAIISLIYDLKYNPNYDELDPDDKKWLITAGLETSISF